jgi:hypothetical protein
MFSLCLLSFSGHPLGAQIEARMTLELLVLRPLARAPNQGEDVRSRSTDPGPWPSLPNASTTKQVFHRSSCYSLWCVRLRNMQRSDPIWAGQLESNGPIIHLSSLARGHSPPFQKTSHPGEQGKELPACLRRKFAASEFSFTVNHST